MALVIDKLVNRQFFTGGRPSKHSNLELNQAEETAWPHVQEKPQLNK